MGTGDSWAVYIWSCHGRKPAWGRCGKSAWATGDLQHGDNMAWGNEDIVVLQVWVHWEGCHVHGLFSLLDQYFV